MKRIFVSLVFFTMACSANTEEKSPAPIDFRHVYVGEPDTIVNDRNHDFSDADLRKLCDKFKEEGTMTIWYTNTSNHLKRYDCVQVIDLVDR